MTSKEALEQLRDKAQLLALFMGKDASDHLVNVDTLYNTIKQDLERLEMELHCKNNSIKTLEAFHKSQIENYLQKENKLLDELISCKQQIKILKKALPYYNIKVLCNAGRITEEELEVLLKYDLVKEYTI